MSPAARYSGKLSFLHSELQTTFTLAKSRAYLLVAPDLLTVDRLVCFDFDINLARLQIPGSEHTRVLSSALLSFTFFKLIAQNRKEIFDCNIFDTCWE